MTGTKKKEKKRLGIRHTQQITQQKLNKITDQNAQHPPTQQLNEPLAPTSKQTNTQTESTSYLIEQSSHHPRTPITDPQNFQQQIQTQNIQKEKEQEDSFLITPRTLINEFKQNIKGKILMNEVNTSTKITPQLRCKIINYVLDIVTEINDQKLNFGHNKIITLKKIARSIIITFPKLKDNLLPNENQDMEFKSMYFYDPDNKKENGHILSRYKFLQMKLKRKRNTNDN